MGTAGNAAVRDSVLRGVARDLQSLMRTGLQCDESLHALVSALPVASSPLEALAVRGLLYDCMTATGACSRWRVTWNRNEGYRLEPVSSPEERSAQSPTTVARSARKQIMSSLSGVSSIRALAEDLGCGRAKLDKVFRQVYGCSVASYVREARVKEALRLLRTTDHKVEAVAYMVGFRGKANLYHAVRQATGKTPGQVRR